MRSASLLTLAISAVLALALAACGTDDGATVTTIGGTESSSGVGSASAPVTSSSATADVACQPVGEDREGQGQAITIVATDFAYSPDEIDLPAGITTFTLDNQGGLNHELAFLPGGGDVPLTDDGQPDEAALEEVGAFELEGFSPGQTCNATYDLEAGDYTLFCVISTEDGQTHYELGMRASLTIS